MRTLNQSTARNVMVFMTDENDGKTGLTGLTLTCTLSKDGAAFASISPTVTERGNGWYNVALTSSHTDTIGDLVLRATATGADSAEVAMTVLVHPASALVAYDPPTKAEMDAAIAAAGTGARTVTITVNDGSTVLQAATVRLSQGAESYQQTTNVSGVATFNVDDATWTVAITKAGYSFAGASLVVDGTEAQTYSMTEVAVTPPSTPGLSAVEVLCVDSAGQPEEGITVDIRMITIPSGSQNVAYRGTKQTATSDSDGIARFEVVQGATYEWKRGLADVWQQVAIDSDSVTNVTSVIGSP